jgi:hypothetical protein
MNVKRTQNFAERGSEGLEDCTSSPLLGKIMCPVKELGAAVVEVLDEVTVQFHLKCTKYKCNIKNKRSFLHFIDV